MSQPTQVTDLELLMDAMNAPYVPTRKHAGWKRDQNMRRTGPTRLRFMGEFMEIPAGEDRHSDASIPSLPQSTGHSRR